MIKETIKMVVFDMAGTTVDEQNVVYKTLHKAIENFGILTDLETVLMIGAGKEKHQAIKDILAYLENANLHDSQAIFNNFKVMLDEAYRDLEVQPITGVSKVLLNLRSEGITVILNTGYSREIATKLLKKLGWHQGEYYDSLIAANDVERGRPHPDMIHKAMKEFNIKDAKHVLKAGDSAIDIEEGKNSKCGVTVGVLSGAQTKQQLEAAEPDFIISSLAELDTIFHS